MYTTKINENPGSRTMYLGKANMKRLDKLSAQEKFPVTEKGYTIGTLLDGTECQMVLDTGTSKSFISTIFI